MNEAETPERGSSGGRAARRWLVTRRGTPNAVATVIVASSPSPVRLHAGEREQATVDATNVVCCAAVRAVTAQDVVATRSFRATHE